MKFCSSTSMRKRWLLYGLLLLRFCTPALGQAEQYRFINFGIRDGLNDKYVYTAVQDKKGYMWFGLATGLYRYDGHVFRHYNSPVDKPGQTIGNVLQALGIDDAGHLWIGSLNTLQWYNPVTNTFWTPDYSQPALRNMGNSYFYNFTTGKNGDMWLATGKNYFFRFNKKDSSFTHFNRYPATASRATLRVILNGETVYAVHSEGLYEFGSDGNLHGFYKMPVDEITNACYYAPANALLITTYNAGLLAFSLQEKKYIFDFAPNEILNKENKFSVTSAADGTVFIGSYPLVRYQPSTKELLHFRKGGSEYNIGAEKIACLYFDRENNLWICSHNGLSMLPWQNNQVQTITLIDPVSGNNVEPTGVFRSPGTNDLLITNTSTAGLIIFNTENRRLTTLVNTHAKNFTDKRIIGLIMAPDSTIYLSDNKQLFKYQPTTKALVPFDIRDQHGKPVAGIGRNIYDSKGVIYIHSYNNGFYTWDYNQNKVTHYNKWEVDKTDSSGSDNYIAPCLVDRNGYCWMTSTNGVYRYNPAAATASHIGIAEQPGVPVMGKTNYIAEDRAGHIWIVTDASGLYEWYIENDREVLKNYNRNSGIGLPVDFCWKIKQDINDSLLWISNTVGLLRFDPVQKKVLSIFSKQNGMAVDDGGYTFNLLPGGLLAQLYYSYLNLVDLNTYQLNRRKPEVSLSSLRVLDTERLFELDSLLPVLRLASHENYLHIEFAALVFNNGNRNQYAYMLEGADKDWVFCGQKNEISYSALKPGTYIFRVKAASSDGVWGNETSVKIIIRPPFYATWWFISICLALVAGLIYLWNRYRIRQVRKEEELKAVFQQQIAETEMKALRAQMNPHFIFNSLNSIQKYILKNEHLEASQYLTKFSRLIRLILDHSNQNSILLSSEIDLLKLYVEMESLRFDNRFDYSITADDHLKADTTEIPSMLVQPYVENAIWHGLLHLPPGERGKLTIHFSRDERQNIKVLIDDNGIGREKAAELKSKQVLKKKSYGMQITEDRIAIINRIQHIHATCEVIDKKDESGQAAGTAVVLIIPTKNLSS